MNDQILTPDQMRDLCVPINGGFFTLFSYASQYVLTCANFDLSSQYLSVIQSLGYQLSAWSNQTYTIANAVVAPFCSVGSGGGDGIFLLRGLSHTFSNASDHQRLGSANSIVYFLTNNILPATQSQMNAGLSAICMPPPSSAIEKRHFGIIIAFGISLFIITNAAWLAYNYWSDRCRHARQHRA